MKKYLILVLSALLIGVGGAVWWSENILPVSASKTPVSVVVPKGASASVVGNKLKKSGVIRSALAFKIFLRVTGRSGRVLPGEYELSPDQSLLSVVSELLKGPKEVWITIPEGFRREEIAIRFADGLGKSGDGYRPFIDEFLSLTKDKEGYLFPDTYLFPKDAPPSLIVSKMLDNFNSRIGSGVGKKEVVLASLIERETKGNEEKPVVAGIILKRLEAGWALQIDATVQYAVAKPPKYWEPLSKADLEIKSPYNTYRNKGLPPAPICSPGLASIKAAVSPQASSYWFYLHDDKGKIHYAGTIEEHGSNVSKYLGK